MRNTSFLKVLGFILVSTMVLGCIGNNAPTNSEGIDSSSYTQPATTDSSESMNSPSPTGSTVTNSPKPKANFSGEYSDFGGWKKVQVESLGFFRVEVVNGTYWLVDPEGYLFVSKGVNAINYLGDHSPKIGYAPYYVNVLRKYGDISVWINVTVNRMVEWGFNTVGSWSSPELYEYFPYTVLLDIGAKYGFNWEHGTMPDIFKDDFEEYVAKAVYFNVEPLKDNPMVIGFFTDNELRWGPDWRSGNHLLDDFMKLPPEAPGKRVAVEVLKETFNGDITRVNEELKTSYESFDDLLTYTGDLPSTPLFMEARKEFVRRYAERYFNVTTTAIRKVDQNHLILGVRFAVSPFIRPPDVVFEVAGKYVDVISLNLYNFQVAPKEYLDHIHEITGKPIMITEFSFRAMDSGLPNTIGAGITVQTQKERAEYTKRFIESFMELPYAVGYHWFKWSDQPKEGRWDGENSNYGLVNIEDEPYEEMVRMFSELNRNIEEIHLKGYEEG
ncbi:glycosyl hydrolase [Thermococcus pacificus]|uniref:Beta-agarase n=1 Tax=Thermococcus pacificus TaxID=71998 RepID=A0A218P8G7_9EURY|nr:glycosyl hydrolase [Thermococcus pacificus]ASJ07082.1 beta-agarase [Thermococcus pacificus]